MIGIRGPRCVHSYYTHGIERSPSPPISLRALFLVWFAYGLPGSFSQPYGLQRISGLGPQQRKSPRCRLPDVRYQYVPVALASGGHQPPLLVGRPRVHQRQGGVPGQMVPWRLNAAPKRGSLSKVGSGWL